MFYTVFFGQFNYQYNTQNGVMALKTFRNLAGGVDSYPATEWFCVKMEDKIRKEIIEKQHVAAGSRNREVTKRYSKQTFPYSIVVYSVALAFCIGTFLLP